MQSHQCHNQCDMMIAYHCHHRIHITILLSLLVSDSHVIITMNATERYQGHFPYHTTTSPSLPVTLWYRSHYQHDTTISMSRQAYVTQWYHFHHRRHTTALLSLLVGHSQIIVTKNVTECYYCHCQYRTTPTTIITSNTVMSLATFSDGILTV